MLPQQSILLWIVLGSLAISFHHLVSRWGLNGIQERGGSPLRFLAWGFSLTALLFGSSYLLTWGWSMPKELLPGFWSATLAGTLANYAIQYLNAKASTYKVGEVSLTAPLSAMTPGLITILAFTLGEVPGIAGFVGIGCMALGSWIIAFPLREKPTHWWGYLRPFRQLRLITHYRTLGEGDRKRTVVVWFMLVAACFGTIGILCDGLYPRRGGDIQGMWLALVVLFGGLAAGYLVPYLLQPSSVKRNSGSLREPKFLAAVILWALLWLTIQWLVKPLYFETYVAYVGTLYRLNILFTVLLGWLLFKEQDIKKRFGVATLVIVGALLIASEDLPARLTSKLEVFGF